MSNIRYNIIIGKARKWIFCALTSLPLGGLGWAFSSCSEYDDYNTAPVDAQAGANNTLWENIVADQQLTKFAALARQSHFSEVLNSARFYTVWAPVDNAFSDAEYQSLMAGDSATIVRKFMQQHITEYNYPVSAALDSTTIVSLNLKHHPFTQQGFDDISYANVNEPAANGVLHKLNGFSQFFNNLYENIDDLTGCDNIKDYIQQYDEYYLDKNASVIGPLVNGKQTYLDSVMAKRNNVIRTIMRADLEDEDSTYCMLIPNDKAWEDAYAKIHPNFNYIAKMDYMDLSKKTIVASDTKATTAKAEKTVETTTTVLQDSLTCRNIVGNLAFTRSYQRNAPLFGEGSLAPEDSVYSASGRYLQNANTVFEHTIAVQEASNGMARIIDSLTFNPWDTYQRPVVVTSPAQTLKVKKLTTHNIPLENLTGRDSLFSKVPPMFNRWLFPETSQFFTYVSVDSADVEGTTGRPEFCFALGSVSNNGSITGLVQSTTYHIYVVTVPEQVLTPEAAVKPYYLRFYLSWTDASNKQQYTVLPQGAKASSEITTDNGSSTATVTYVGDPDRVNVIDLGEFTFPASYYGLDAYPSLMMMHTKSYTTSANRKKYDQQMRVAGVFLIPKDYNDKFADASNE